MTEKRYKLIRGSESVHCCFDATVVDTHAPVIVEGKIVNYTYVCECFDLEWAENICSLLNSEESKK